MPSALARRDGSDLGYPSRRQPALFIEFYAIPVVAAVVVVVVVARMEYTPQISAPFIALSSRAPYVADVSTFFFPSMCSHSSRCICDFFAS